MSEVKKIARFVGIEACKSIFSENSTFVLRSPKHYRRLYEINEGETGKGDKAEGSAQILGGGTAEFTGFVASCWTILLDDEDEPTSEEWDIFKKNDQNIVAIVSTPSKVCELLYKSLETNKECTKRRFPFYSVEHRAVCYGKMPSIDKNSIMDVPFVKCEKFRKEKEYRFVLTYGSPNLIDSLIFCGGIDYMEKCLGNPKMGRENKKVLWDTLMKATNSYGDFEDKNIPHVIANARDIFCQ